MKRNQLILMLLLATLAGLLGGILGGRFIPGDLVFAAKAPQPEKVVIAEKFVLVDVNGVKRAELSEMDEDSMKYSGVNLWFFDSNEKTRAVIGITNNMPIISLYDKNEKPRLSLSIPATGPAIHFVEENGTARIALGLDLDGPGLSLFNPNGKGGAELAVDNNTPMLRFIDANEKTRIGLLLKTDGSAGVRLSDANGTTRGQFGIDNDGPRVDLLYANGKRGAKLHVLSNDSILALYNFDGESRAELGVMHSKGVISLEDERGKNYFLKH